MKLGSSGKLPPGAQEGSRAAVDSLRRDKATIEAAGNMVRDEIMVVWTGLSWKGS